VKARPGVRHALNVAPGARLYRIAPGFYELVTTNQLAGWVEQGTGRRSWLKRLPDDEECLPGIHPTRLDAAASLLTLQDQHRTLTSRDWPVRRTADGIWLICCTRRPCVSVFATDAANEVEAFIAARDKGWSGDDWPCCPLLHQVLGGVA
jgi:hypothetical protein